MIRSPRVSDHAATETSAAGSQPIRIRARLFCLPALGVACACWGAPDLPARRVLVLSYNIHHGAGTDGIVDLERIAAVIRNAAPDVVSLQEVDQGTRRSAGIDQARALAERTGMFCVFGASMDFMGGRYGNAVLTRSAVERSATVPLPGEPRSALCVSVPASVAGDDAFDFIATHLDTQKAPRLASIAPIERLLAARGDTPTILAGDINATPGSETLRALLRTWSNATQGDGLITFPAGSPVRQADYVLYRPASRWRVVSARVLDEAVASDHRPIVAVLELLPGAQTRDRRGDRDAEAGETR